MHKCVFELKVNEPGLSNLEIFKIVIDMAMFIIDTGAEFSHDYIVIDGEDYTEFKIRTNNYHVWREAEIMLFRVISFITGPRDSTQQL